MKARIAFGFIVMMVVLTLPATAGGKGELQKYFNNAASKVKAVESPAEKRAILNESFQDMSSALEMVQQSPLISKEDHAGIESLRAAVQEKQSELAGTNGYEQVPDAQLNAFSNYVVQDMEQADEMVSISVVSLLIILLIVVILF